MEIACVRKRQYLKRVVHFLKKITHACLQFFLHFIDFEDIRLRNHQYLKRVAHILKSGFQTPDPEPAIEKINGPAKKREMALVKILIINP